MLWENISIEPVKNLTGENVTIKVVMKDRCENCRDFDRRNESYENYPNYERHENTFYNRKTWNEKK